MRISDWSSDVCSSDLRAAPREAAAGPAAASPGVDPVPAGVCAAGVSGLALDCRVGARWRARFRFGHQNQNRRSEEHTSELQSLMRISYAVFCSTKKTYSTTHTTHYTQSTEPAYFTI